jgi:hypothetical protein
MMAKQPVAKPDSDTDIDLSAKRLVHALCLNVLGALGRPLDFLQITARQITENSYRVNVIAGTDAVSARIAHSFFVTADANGNLTGSDPVIMKRY